MRTGRRPFLHALSAVPFALSGCQPRQPETPLAHLHGQQWVHGAYEHYARAYQDMQARSEQRTFDAYGVLAGKGIVALDALQSREVPFHITADVEGQRFTFQRYVPERLTFSADMSEADREKATVAWKHARQHIHKDYDEIRRLDGALTSLLSQLQQVRSTIDRTREEQFEVVLQVGELAQGPPPFALPYQVSARDYERVLLLLLERLEDDRGRLERIESAVVAVGFTVRATDANSGSLAANVRKVLLSVVEETASSPLRTATFPEEKDKHDALVATGRTLLDQIRSSQEFAAWQKARSAQQLQQIGSLLTVLDALTGVPASAIFRKAIDLWSGNDDYLSYLQVLTGIVPGGGKLAETLDQAVEVTRTVRSGSDRLRAIEKGERVDVTEGIVNVGSRFARDRVERQLVFYRDADEVRTVQDALARTDWVNRVR